MKRTTRMEIAQETVKIVEQGSYISGQGDTVEIAEQVQSCNEQTRLFSPTELKRLRNDVLANSTGNATTVCEVVNETTLSGIARLLSEGSEPVAALNFASAKNPGGGFLNGSQAQEESLARSSSLYSSLLQAWDFYEQHRASPSLVYSDTIILSPDCPLFRDDEGSLLEKPQKVTFITCAAPNAGAAANNRPAELSVIPDIFLRRAEYILAVAAAHGYKRLVLGAWGCGVFRNDPTVVAEAFASHLRGIWVGRFEKVVFSVLDASATRETFDAFQSALG